MFKIAGSGVGWEARGKRPLWRSAMIVCAGPCSLSSSHHYQQFKVTVSNFQCIFAPYCRRRWFIYSSGWQMRTTHSHRGCSHWQRPGLRDRGHPPRHSSPCCRLEWAGVCRPRTGCSSSRRCPAPPRSTPGPGWCTPYWPRSPGQRWGLSLKW